MNSPSAAAPSAAPAVPAKAKVVLLSLILVAAVCAFLITDLGIATAQGQCVQVQHVSQPVHQQTDQSIGCA